LLENVEGDIVVLALPFALAGFLDEVLVGGLLLAVVGVDLVLGILVRIIVVALFGFLGSGEALETALDADEKAVILVEGREGETEGRLHQPHPHPLLAFLPSHHLRVDLQVPPREAKTQRHLLHPLDCARYCCHFTPFLLCFRLFLGGEVEVGLSKGVIVFHQYFKLKLKLVLSPLSEFAQPVAEGGGLALGKGELAGLAFRQRQRRFLKFPRRPPSGEPPQQHLDLELHHFFLPSLARPPPAISVLPASSLSGGGAVAGEEAHIFLSHREYYNPASKLLDMVAGLPHPVPKGLWGRKSGYLE
jgi:hypothetical protein